MLSNVFSHIFHTEVIPKRKSQLISEITNYFNNNDLDDEEFYKNPRTSVSIHEEIFNELDSYLIDVQNCQYPLLPINTICSMQVSIVLEKLLCLSSLIKSAPVSNICATTWLYPEKSLSYMYISSHWPTAAAACLVAISHGRVESESLALPIPIAPLVTMTTS